jgi:transcriptional regulator with XRE-family HTH domain
LDAGAAGRLRQARAQAALTPEQVAVQLGITTAAYHDLESFPGELSSTISVRQLRRLGEALGVNMASLLLGAHPLVDEVSAGDLVDALRARVAASGASVDDLGSQIGWDIGPLLQNPEQLWELNLDGLQDICAFVGVDWTSLLAATPSTDK